MKFGYNRGWETTMYLSHYLSKVLRTIMSKTLMPDSKHTASSFFNLFGSLKFHDYLNLVRIPKKKYSLIKLSLCLFLFDLILYVYSTIFQLCGTVFLG